MPTLIALLLVAAAPAPAASAPPLPSGEEVWTKRCAGCHGDDGKGDTHIGRKYKVADFTDPAWPTEWTLAKVEQTVSEGIDKKMPAWKDRLSADEIKVVSQYALALAKPAAAKPPAGTK